MENWQINTPKAAALSMRLPVEKGGRTGGLSASGVWGMKQTRSHDDPGRIYPGKTAEDILPSHPDSALGAAPSLVIMHGEREDIRLIDGKVYLPAGRNLKEYEEIEEKLK